MAAGKMCSRKGKAETAEVCLICVITYNFSYLLTYRSIFSEWICLNVVLRGLLRFLCTAKNCAIVCGSRVTTRRFPPSASLPLFYVWSGQDCSRMNWKQNRTPLCLSRGWWQWLSPPSPISGGFFQRRPTDQDIWKVKHSDSLMLLW